MASPEVLGSQVIAMQEIEGRDFYTVSEILGTSKDHVSAPQPISIL